MFLLNIINNTTGRTNAIWDKFMDSEVRTEFDSNSITLVDFSPGALWAASTEKVLSKYGAVLNKVTGGYSISIIFNSEADMTFFLLRFS